MDTVDPSLPPARNGLPPWVAMAARLLATVALMAYALSGISWHDREVDGVVTKGMLTVLTQANWSWWALGLATGMVVQVVAGIRWAELARPLGFAHSRLYFVRRFFEGAFFSLCLPSSIGGDVIKAYRIGDTTQRRLLAGCSVLADRLTGLSALGVLGGAAFAARKYGLSLPTTLAVAFGLLAGVLGAFLGGLSMLDRLISTLPAPHGLRGLMAQLLPYQQRPSLIAKAVGWSFVVQMGGAIAVAFSSRALGVNEPLSLWFSVVPLVALAMVLPISIGGFGVRENAMSLLLAEQGVPAATGVAVALLWGLSTILSGLLGGALVLFDRSARITPVVETRSGAGHR
jgi:uncharacterized membrane protein YbhN (UPF0104 family)